MSASIAVRPKKRGRPATGRDPLLNVRAPAPLREALDAYVAAQDGPASRSEAIRVILTDWLTGHGYFKHRDDPEGANGKV